MNDAQQIKTLGILSGKLLFFGGVYSNLQSLETLQAWANTNHFSPSNIFCTGDIVGYCAQPVECIELIKSWGIHSIAGNVELQLSHDEDDCGCDFADGGRCDLFSKNWYSYSKALITGKEKNWLSKLLPHLHFTYEGKSVVIVHGSFLQMSDYIFQSTPWEKKVANFNATGADIIIAGHCGLPFADKRTDKLWLNAGVIGMPANDGTERVWFLTMEPGTHDNINYQFHHYEYNNKLAADLMQQSKLPSAYAATLRSGIWDNCEILPEVETALQGKKIML